MTLQEVRERAIALVRQDYANAEKAIIRLEVFTRSRSKKAVYQLRDFLNHLHHIFTTDDAAKAQRHLVEAETHLRRATLEPIEYLAEKHFVMIDEGLDQWIFKIPFRGNPRMRSDFSRKMFEAREHIFRGRTQKMQHEAYVDFEKAFEISTELLAEVHPLQWRVKVLKTAVPIIAGCLAIGVALGPLYNWAFRPAAAKQPILISAPPPPAVPGKAEH